MRDFPAIFSSIVLQPLKCLKGTVAGKHSKSFAVNYQAGIVNASSGFTFGRVERLSQSLRRSH